MRPIPIADKRFFRPVPGLAGLRCGPRARALGYSLSPCGLWEHAYWLQLRCAVGQPIQAADPLSSGSSRLKAGCRQDCLPHKGI
jgi:hypothetical protein